MANHKWLQKCVSYSEFTNPAQHCIIPSQMAWLKGSTVHYSTCWPQQQQNILSTGRAAYAICVWHTTQAYTPQRVHTLLSDVWSPGAHANWHYVWHLPMQHPHQSMQTTSASNWKLLIRKCGSRWAISWTGKKNYMTGKSMASCLRQGILCCYSPQLFLVDAPESYIVPGQDHLRLWTDFLM